MCKQTARPVHTFHDQSYNWKWAHLVNAVLPNFAQEFSSFHNSPKSTLVSTKGRSGLFEICLGLSYWTGKFNPMSYKPHSAVCYLYIFLLSHQAVLRWKPPELLLPRTLLLTSILSPESAYLDSSNWCGRSFGMNYGKYQPLPFHDGKRKSYSQHQQEKKQLHGIKTRTPLVPNRRAKDNFF